MLHTKDGVMTEKLCSLLCHVVTSDRSQQYQLTAKNLVCYFSTYLFVTI